MQQLNMIYDSDSFQVIVSALNVIIQHNSKNSLKQFFYKNACIFNIYLR